MPRSGPENHALVLSLEDHGLQELPAIAAWVFVKKLRLIRLKDTSCTLVSLQSPAKQHSATLYVGGPGGRASEMGKVSSSRMSRS